MASVSDETARQHRELIHRRYILEGRTLDEVVAEVGIGKRSVCRHVAAIRKQIAEQACADRRAAAIDEMYNSLLQYEYMAIRSGSIRNALQAASQRMGLMSRMGWFAPAKVAVQHAGEVGVSGAVAVAVAPAVSAAEVAAAYAALGIAPPGCDTPALPPGVSDSVAPACHISAPQAPGGESGSV